MHKEGRINAKERSGKCVRETFSWFIVHCAHSEWGIYRHFYAMCKVLNSVLNFFLLFPRNACIKQTHERTECAGFMLSHTQNVHFILISIITVMQSHVFGARDPNGVIVVQWANEFGINNNAHVHRMVWMVVRHSQRKCNHFGSAIKH